MRNLKSLLLLLSSVAILSACSSTTKLDDKAKVEDRGADARSVSTVSADSDALNDPKGVLAKRSVYFGFDKYDVNDDGKQVVEAHSKFLNANKGRKVIIQGNTDERGGSEYNLALGQKRAEAVRKSMSLLGVSEGQLEAVSLGKEKPKAEGHNEAAWAENRRADIVY